MHTLPSPMTGLWPMYRLKASAGPRNAFLCGVDREGREAPLKMQPRAYRRPRLSPDGTKVAVEVFDEANAIWTYDVQRETLTRLTLNRPSTDPVWSYDGKRIAFLSEGKIYGQAADGSGAAQLLRENPGVQMVPQAFSPDGESLLLSKSRPPYGVYLFQLSGHTESTLLSSRFDESNPAISPVGHWMAYESSETGSGEIYVRPFPNINSGKWLISRAGGARPLWNRNGKELLYADANGQIMAVTIKNTPDGFAAGNPQVVVKGDYFNPAGGYDVSPDGRRFLMLKNVDNSPQAQPSQIVLVQNFFEELRQLLPTAK
jgi:Tol biopolymer transport system component